MMSDEEIKRTIYYLQGVVRRKYMGFSNIDDLIDEVPLGLALAITKTDFTKPSYRSFISQCVMYHISNYWDKHFYVRHAKALRPAVTIDIQNSEYKDDAIEKYADPSITEFDAVKKIRLESELAKLTDRERDVIESRLINGEPLLGIANRLGVSKAAVSLIFNNARFKLAKRLACYRSKASDYAKCTRCGAPCPADRTGRICSDCRDLRRNGVLRKWRINLRARKGIKERVFKKAVAA